jgi:hypothetical protein
MGNLTDPNPESLLLSVPCASTCRGYLLHLNETAEMALKAISTSAYYYVTAAPGEDQWRISAEIRVDDDIIRLLFLASTVPEQSLRVERREVVPYIKREPADACLKG